MNMVPGKVSVWVRFKGWCGHLRHLNFLDFKETKLKAYTGEFSGIQQTEIMELVTENATINSKGLRE